MTWTKLSDDFADEPAMLALDRGVRLLRVEALVWCNRHGTDGHVPAHMLARITDEPDPHAAAAHLVESGLWKPTENGWEIVGFLEDQPSAADVERTLALARERQRRQRQHRNGDHSLCDSRYCHAASSAVTRDSRVSNGVSHDTPTRSDPTRAAKAKGRDRGTADAAAPKGSRRHAAPQGFTYRISEPEPQPRTTPPPERVHELADSARAMLQAREASQ